VTKTELEIVRHLVAILKDLKKLMRWAKSRRIAEDFRCWLSTRHMEAKSCLQVACGVIRRGRKNEH